MDGTTRTLNFTKQVGVTLLVEKRLKGQDMADDSSTLSDTHRWQSESLTRLDNIKICTF